MPEKRHQGGQVQGGFEEQGRSGGGLFDFFRSPLGVRQSASDVGVRSVRAGLRRLHPGRGLEMRVVPENSAQGVSATIWRCVRLGKRFGSRLLRFISKIRGLFHIAGRFRRVHRPSEPRFCKDSGGLP